MSAKQPSDTKLSPAKLRMVSDERGAVLALVALLLVVFLGLAALAIDLGMLYVARGEAQRAADAAAHGAAVHFKQNFGDEDGSRDAAVEVGARNLIRGQPAVINREDDIDFLMDERKIRVRTHRIATRDNAVRTLFAGVIGFQTADVSAVAAAQIWPATASDCVLPLAIPDRWCINGIGPDGPCSEYSDGMESGSAFEDDHYYVPWLDPVTQEQNEHWTGYSDQNYGDPLIIKPQSPQGALQPGWFFPFRLPGVQGAKEYKEAIQGCRTGNTTWGVGDYVDTEPGNMVGPTEQGFNALVGDYPDADWDDDLNEPVGNPDHIAGRTRPIVVFNPENPPPQGAHPFQVTNFAAVFVEGVNPNGDVQVRFVELTGLEPAPNFDPTQVGPGTQLTIIRIVE